MLSLWKPSTERLRAFVVKEATRDFSYPAVGATVHGTAPPGFDHDHNRVRLGRGANVFDSACRALRQWRQFPRPWTQVVPADAPLAVGTTVAVLIRLFGVWSVNSARIVYLIDETAPLRRFGFAYGTLPGHLERGEERFSVECEADETVWYDLRAFSRPRLWAARLAYPYARRLQRRFVRDSQAAMRAAVG